MAIANKVLIQSIGFYGIFIAALLTPLNRNLSIQSSFQDGAPALVERLLVGVWGALFFSCILFGATEKASFFRIQ